MGRRPPRSKRTDTPCPYKTLFRSARSRPERVGALVGIAPAPDFVVRMWSSLTAQQREALQRDGRFERPSSYSSDPYPITRRLIDEGRDHLLLERPIDRKSTRLNSSH